MTWVLVCTHLAALSGGACIGVLLGAMCAAARFEDDRHEAARHPSWPTPRIVPNEARVDVIDLHEYSKHLPQGRS